MRDYHSKFEPGYFYHIYNRANGHENLFLEPKNYDYFLKKWNYYLDEYQDVLTYCLLPNHFHLLIRVKELDQENLSGLVSNQFGKLFNSYAKSFNKAYGRRGSLFQKPFKHVLVDSQEYLFTLIHYIHHNPIHHHFVKDLKEWRYSSYSTYLSESLTNFQKDYVLDHFGGINGFIKYHQQLKNYKEIKHLIYD